jgi:SRSO17 transposase
MSAAERFDGYMAYLPVAWQLYLPKDWAVDAQRRAKAGIPELD